MKEIDGVKYIKKSQYALFHIYDLTNDLKDILKKRLSFICYGRSASESDLTIYNYRYTLKEFISRYENKSCEKQKGMIGELLSHVIINEYFDEYYIVSPFFNKEERNVKKGFDVVLSEKSGDHSVWITEVKSGELHKGKDANKTTCDLIETAKRDLLERLNEKDNYVLWHNAINDAIITFQNNKSIKDAVIHFLDNYGTKGDNIQSKKSSDINVFLVSALFAPLTDAITEATVKSKSDNLQTKKFFKKTFILSLQKETYQKVYHFLKEESEKNE